MPTGTGTHYSGPVYSDAGFVSAGFPVLPPGIPLHAGNYYWVNANATSASDSNTGLDRTKPLSTVNAAIGKCTANNDDAIVLLPGHTETVTATSIALNVAGVSIYGLGTGLKRPTFTYGAAAATITVSAANCRWAGCHFVANFADVAAAFTLGAAKDFELNTNTFADTSSILNFLSIVVTGSTNNAADGLKVFGNRIHSLPTTDGAVISILGNLDRLRVVGNYARKAATNDAGHFMTLSSKIIGGAEISGNKLIVVGATTATVGIFLTGSGTTSTGSVDNNYVSSLDTTTELITTAGTGLSFFENYYTGTADASGKLWPAVDAA